MADSTPTGQIASLRRQLLTFQQACEENRGEGGNMYSDSAAAELHSSSEMSVGSSASSLLPGADGSAVATEALHSTERPLHASGAKGVALTVTSMTSPPDAGSTKSQRLHSMQKTLLEQQQQLLRQREQLQQQQRLLFQRAQGRSATPQSLAQLFAELHESRQLQLQQTGSREQKPDGRVASNFRSGGSPSGCECTASFSGKHQRIQLGERASFGLNDGSAGDTTLDQWTDRRRVLRAVALLDGNTVMKCTLRSLGHRIGCAQGTKAGSMFDGRRLSFGKDDAGACCAARCRNARSCCPAHSWSSTQSTRGLADSTGGKVMQVHGQPLPAAALFAGLSSGAPWRHCLRVTLNARRCAIRTRRCWRALVPLFPRRTAYTPAAVLSDDEVDSYTHIGPRTTSLVQPGTHQESWEPPREPFTAPGLYTLREEGGSMVAAWAVALGIDGQLKRRVAVIEPLCDVGSQAAVLKRKRQTEQQIVASHDPGQSVSDEFGVISSQVEVLKGWYAEVANEPLAAQQLRSLTLADYTAGFAQYAQDLVASLGKLIEVRQSLPYVGRVADGCGCSCSICVGLPCRVRLAWRRQVMAFEVAVDKPAGARHHSDSSMESEGGSTEVALRARPAGSARTRKGRWEWCRRCPLGCRMQLCLILHELYQPLALTPLGLRSALAHLLLRLRRYVTLSPLATEFLMQRVGEIRSFSSNERGALRAAKSTAAENHGFEDPDGTFHPNWSTRDWAEVCWQRREQRRQAQPFTSVIGSDNLGSSIARLSMLSSPLLQPESATIDTASKNRSSTIDGDYLSTYPLLPKGRNSSVMENCESDQEASFLLKASHGGELKLADGLEALALRAAAAAAVGARCDEAVDGDIKNSGSSYPVSNASSPSACSTPPRQSSRPRMGHCCAVSRDGLAPHCQADERASDDFSAPSLEECQLHIHCDGTAKSRRGRGVDRADWGRAGHGGDGDGLEVLDFSPRRLRRMQRARLTPEEHQLPPPRRVEIPMRVMPLVPWWWEEYVKTGRANTGSAVSAKGVGDCASDGSSSVSSTISLTASPHLFRLRCRETAKFTHSRDELEWQDCDSLAAVAAATRVGETPAKDDRSSNERTVGTAFSAENFQQTNSGTCVEGGGDLAIELIHAAAQLVDSLDSWPLDCNAEDSIKSPGKLQRLPLSEGQENLPAGADLPATSAATCASTLLPHARRSSQGSNSREAEALGSGSSQCLLTFVSAVLTVPADEDVESLRGFELLQGALRMLFSSVEALQEDMQQNIAASSSFRYLQQELGHPSLMVDAAPGAESAGGDISINLAQQTEDPARPAISRRGNSSVPPVDICASTPLLRSLAASAAPAVEPQGRLAVDDFYAHPFSKRAISYPDTYEPFDKDYTDIQIRLKPMRAFGLRQQRYSRHRRRSWRQSSQSTGSSPLYNSPTPSGFAQRKPLQRTSSRDRVGGSIGDQSGTVRIGGRRVVVRTVDGGSGWASREPSTGGLSDISVSRYSMSVDSSLSSRGMSLCSRATSNTGSASDASLQGGGTLQRSSAHEGPTRSRRGRSRPPAGGRTAGGGGNSSTPTGVYLDVARKLWRCQWRENGRFKTKSFPLNQYKTLKEARRACVIFRCLMGGWEVQPAWLGDDEGADIQPSEGSAASQHGTIASPNEMHSKGTDA
ncbi:hypothetical protein Efla_001097 [Eimeria flavescens]